MEFVPTTHSIQYLHNNLATFMRPQQRQVAAHFQPARAWVQYQPLGVVGILSPWNQPLALNLIPLATALAAGNRVMLKPSELTPRTAALLQRMMAELFPPEQVAVVTGDAQVGAAFSALPFDHLMFSGSTQVGRAVMRSASDNLVPVTLELGGKSPAIIDRGADLQRTAKALAYGKLSNAGQTCIAPDYVLVHADNIDAFANAYQAAVVTAYPGGAADTGYTAIINAHHHARLRRLIDDAAARGAQVIEIGASTIAPPQAPSPQLYIVPQTLILGATPDMAVMREEIFGPILPVVAYQELKEAVAFVNARPRPLALYMFSNRGSAINHVLKHTTSGGAAINDTMLHYAQDDLPFGGVGASGIGAYHGEEGFRRFSHAKGVFKQSIFFPARLVRAPFGKLTDLALRWLLR